MDLGALFDLEIISRVVDVALVSFIIYKALLFVRGTRAQPMLLGLVIILVIYLASKNTNLVVVNWLLSNLLGSAILLIVVLFQDDLRRALTKMGLISGFGLDTQVKESVRSVVGAVAEFSSRKIGALIVIQGEVGLDEYKENAVKVDAILSKQLLSAIFCKESPIHDGAVIIDRDRVEVAGAVLPLTFNSKLVQGLGTRHRAALGLSERTDAVVIVVSEETGGITLIRDGSVSKDINVGNLKTRLDILLNQEVRESVVEEMVDDEKLTKEDKSVPERGETATELR